MLITPLQFFQCVWLVLVADMTRWSFGVHSSRSALALSPSHLVAGRGSERLWTPHVRKGTELWSKTGDQSHGSTSKTRLVTCSSTRELTRAVATYVGPDDVVAELGSQLRDVSTEICKRLDKTRGGRAVLVDVVRKFPTSAESRTRAMRLEGIESSFYPDVSTFRQIPNIEDWRKALFFPTSKLSLPSFYTVFVVDVSSVVGNDLEWTTLSLVQEFLGINESGGKEQHRPPVVVLVKSNGLNSLACRLVHGRKWVDRGSPDASELASPSLQQPMIVATVGVDEYRQTIPCTVQPGDAVLEVGCHLGTTTNILNQHVHPVDGGYCFGVDVGSSIVEGAKTRYPSMFFAVGDAWRTAELLRLQNQYLVQMSEAGTAPSSSHRSTGFDVVYVDVGGLSGSDGLLEALSLVTSIQYALEPRCIVIKSLCMRRLSSRLTSFWQRQKEKRMQSGSANIS